MVTDFDNLFALAWMIGAPVAFLCFQYGWDLFLEAVVPVHPDYLKE